MGAVTLPLRFGELVSQVKFYIIDADTSYKALIGRPWLHENNAVPSTLHQCLKYVKDGKIKQINGDVRPFAAHEAGMKDAKYFMKTPVKKATHAYAGSSKQRSQSRVMGAIPTHHQKMKST